MQDMQKSHIYYSGIDTKFTPHLPRLSPRSVVTARKGCDEESERYLCGCGSGSGMGYRLPAGIRRMRYRLHLFVGNPYGKRRTIRSHGDLGGAQVAAIWNAGGCPQSKDRT